MINENTVVCSSLSKIIKGNTFNILPLLEKESVDMIFADPPYFLSNNGTSCKNGKRVSVNKGEWDKQTSFDEMHQFNRNWLKLCYNILKPNGTIWISGTFHNIYSVGVALVQESYEIINNVTWQKPNPPPNLACRYFTHSTETVIWARKKTKKVKHYFNYELMKEINGNKQMKDVWTGTAPSKSEKNFGNHPAQKPEWLLERIILASTQEGDTVLDPFCGSGTTGVVSERFNRNFIGIDESEEFVNLSVARIINETSHKR